MIQMLLLILMFQIFLRFKPMLGQQENTLIRSEQACLVLLGVFYLATMQLKQLKMSET